MDELDKKVYDVFSGRVVKKGATKLVKGASNVPTYVLEYLLGTYCTSDDDKEIEDGIAQVKKILADNYVRNDEVELIKSRIRDFGSYNVIDVVDAHFNEKRNVYIASLHNMGISNVIPDRFVKKMSAFSAMAFGVLFNYLMNMTKMQAVHSLLMKLRLYKCRASTFKRLLMRENNSQKKNG